MNDTWWVRPDQLDDDQKPLVNLPLSGSFTILGPPGSGKTNLLVLRATQLLRSNKKKIRMLVFSRTLEEFLASCPTAYRLPRDYLRTCQRWVMELINALNGVPATSGDFESVRKQNAEILTNLLDSQKLGKLFEVLLLDEAQDYLVEEIALFFRIAEDVFAAADSRQRIFDHPDRVPALKERSVEKLLRLHYRNGRKICMAADSIGAEWDGYSPMLNTSQYNEAANPSTVIDRGELPIANQADEIIAAIRRQLVTFPEELIGVMAPRHEELDVLKAALRNSDLHPIVAYQAADDAPISFTPDTRICVCTVHSGKGLEFRAAHIAGAEFFSKFRERQRRMAYTALTRAKTALTVYHDAQLPTYLSGSIAAANPVASPAPFEGLFEEE